MSVFAVVLDEPNPEVAARIQDQYPGHYRLNDTLFLVSSHEVAEKVAQAVGITGDQSSHLQSGVVFRLNHYYSGFTSRTLWEWLEQAEKYDERG